MEKDQFDRINALFEEFRAFAEQYDEPPTMEAAICGILLWKTAMAMEQNPEFSLSADEERAMFYCTYVAMGDERAELYRKCKATA